MMTPSSYPNSQSNHERNGGWLSQAMALACAFALIGCGNDGGTTGGGGGGEDNTAAIGEKMTALGSGTDEDKANALNFLADQGEAGKAAKDNAIELLKSETLSVRSAAVDYLAKQAINTPEAAAGLGDLATGEADETVMSNALNALAAIGATDKHVEICKALLSSDDERKRGYAAMSLSAAGENAAGAQAELIKGLDDKEPYVQTQCAIAIGGLGAKASADAKAKLETLTSSSDADLAKAAKDALANLNK